MNAKSFFLSVVIAVTAILTTSTILVADSGSWAATRTSSMGDYWTLKAPLPVAQLFWGQHSAVVNKKIYTLGGCVENGMCPTDNVWEYDPGSDQWTAKSPIPTKRLAPQTAVVNAKIYVIGGGNGDQVFDVVEEYTPATDTWRTGLASIPTARHDFGAEFIGGMIYAFGGVNWQQQNIHDLPVERYDPASNRWVTVGPAMLTPRTYFGSGTVNGKIYAFGGINYSGLGWLGSNEEFDPSTRSWKYLSPLSLARDALGYATVNNKIYAIGGRLNNISTYTKIVEQYTPPANLFATTDIVSLGDVNKDNNPEIAVVSHDADRQRTLAVIKNAKNGAFIRKIPFDGQYAPLKAAAVNDLNG